MSKNEHVYANKDKFVTSAYKKKLAEQAKWLEEEWIRELREEKDDVMMKIDLVTSTSTLERMLLLVEERLTWESQNRNKKKQWFRSQEAPENVPPATSTSSESSRLIKRQYMETSEDLLPEEKLDASTKDQAADKPLPTDQLGPIHHKSSEDAVAAAKERFLARKKAKEQ